MTIVVQLDVMLAKRKVKSKALAEYVGITEVNVSLLKQGKVKGVRFETLERICEFLDCQPGDLLEYKPTAEKNLLYLEGGGKGDRGGDHRS